MPLAEGWAVSRIRAFLDDGVTDIGARQAVGLEERRLERQQREYMIEKPGDFGGASRTRSGYSTR